VIRKVNLEDNSLIPEQKQEFIIQKKMVQYALQYLEDKYGEDRLKSEHVQNLQSRLKAELNFFNQELETTDHTGDNSLKDYQHIYLE